MWLGIDPGNISVLLIWATMLVVLLILVFEFGRMMLARRREERKTSDRRVVGPGARHVRFETRDGRGVSTLEMAIVDVQRHASVRVVPSGISGVGRRVVEEIEIRCAPICVGEWGSFAQESLEGALDFFSTTALGSHGVGVDLSGGLKYKDLRLMTFVGEFADGYEEPLVRVRFVRDTEMGDCAATMGDVLVEGYEDGGNS